MRFHRNPRRGRHAADRRLAELASLISLTPHLGLAPLCGAAETGIVTANVNRRIALILITNDDSRARREDQ